MASSNCAQDNKEYAEDPSNGSTSAPAIAQQQDENPDMSITCPAVLEPSEDDPLFKREETKGPSKSYKAIMKSYNSTDVYVNSDDPSNDGKCKLTAKCRSVWVDLFNHYKNFSEAFRNSNLFYIVKLWLILLSFSAIVMGNIYNRSCPGSPNLVDVTVLTGIFGFLLASQWIAVDCCPPVDRPCDGQQKYGILLFFILVSAMLEVEIYLFSQLSPSFEPSTTNYCIKAFYDYTYYKFIATFGSMLLVVLLYIPSYRGLASGVVCSDPVTASCYRGIMEDL